MNTRPIIMSGQSLAKILDGTKTQTRRIINPRPPSQEAVGELSGASQWRPYQPSETENRWVAAGSVWAVRKLMGQEPRWRCPYGIPGDRLWVRETWRPADHDFGEPPWTWLIQFKADKANEWGKPPEDRRQTLADRWGTAYANGGCDPRWRSPLFMPRWASRLTLEVVSVRVERVKDITDADARAEGAQPAPSGVSVYPGSGAAKVKTYRAGFAHGWDTINAKRAPWGANPWVWVVEFRRVET